MSSTLIATDNIEEAITFANQCNGKIIYMGEPSEVPPVYQREFVFATLVLPDYATMEANINGDYDSFAAKYSAQLCSTEAVMFFSTMIAALYMGNNIIILFPKDTGELWYSNFFLNYLMEVYGIQACTKNTNFVNANLPQNWYLIYMNNMINGYMYILNGTIFDEPILNKLYSEIKPTTKCNTITDYSNFIAWLKNQMMASGTVLVSPIAIDGDDNNASNRR